MKRVTLLVISVSLGGMFLHAADWPQYRGPNHDGSSPDALERNWTASPPRVLWRTRLNQGFSSFAVGGGKVFTLMLRNVDGADREACVALDAETGKELWAYTLGIAKYDHGYDAESNDGPRSTPTFSDGKVYALSANLVLACLDAETGKALWSKDLIRDHAGRNITWQNAASPVLDGEMVFVAGGGPGQSLLAFHRKTGALMWKGQNERLTHATPVAATIHGMRQVIFFTQSGLVGAAAQSGHVLWRYKFPFSTSTAASPVVAGDTVYCSAGYGVGSGAVKVTRTGSLWSARELWRRPGDDLCNHWSTPVHHNGYLYGLFSFKEHGTGPLKCVDLETGKEMWSQAGFGPGNVIKADDLLLVLSDEGQLVLVQPTPASYQELGRVPGPRGTCWSMPAVSNRRIYARSAREGVCLDVAVKPAQSK